MGRVPWTSRSVGDTTFETLARNLSGSELQSLLMAVMAERARAREPKHVLAQFERDAFCTPALVDQRAATAIDVELLAAAATFEALELSPVAPLGVCSSVALTSQNRVLSALRATEIVSDPTNVLALECAQRLRRSAADIHLATSQRVIRAQPVPKLPGYAQHFRIFVLASAGVERKDHAFTVEALTLHLHTMCQALDRLELCGYAFGARRISLLATPERASLADRVASAMDATTRDVVVERAALEHPYYSAGIRYQLWVTSPDGTPMPLIDGGTFDWLKKLATNERAVYVASGMGSQLVPLRFRAGRGESGQPRSPRDD